MKTNEFPRMPLEAKAFVALMIGAFLGWLSPWWLQIVIAVALYLLADYRTKKGGIETVIDNHVQSAACFAGMVLMNFAEVFIFA